MRELGNLQPPGTCSLCGNGTDLEGYLDIDLWIEYYGQVYLCMSKCALQVVETIGALIPSEAKQFLETTQNIATEYAELKEKYNAAIARLAVYDDAVIAAASSNLAATFSEDESEAGDEPNASPAKPADSGESGAKEPTKGAGPDDPALFELRDESTFTI